MVHFSAGFILYAIHLPPSQLHTNLHFTFCSHLSIDTAPFNPFLPVSLKDSSWNIYFSPLNVHLKIHLYDYFFFLGTHRCCTFDWASYVHGKSSHPWQACLSFQPRSCLITAFCKSVDWILDTAWNNYLWLWILLLGDVGLAVWACVSNRQKNRRADLVRLL